MTSLFQTWCEHSRIRLLFVSFPPFATAEYALTCCFNVSGTAGDAFTVHRGQPFSTQEQDNDNANANCARHYRGAWWYNKCHHSNLNGFYFHGNHSSYADGVNWRSWRGYHYSLKRTEMKIRPMDFWSIVLENRSSDCKVVRFLRNKVTRSRHRVLELE